ncbi:MAG: hypothetical protein COA34_014935 [Methylophaga sp.]|jgi:hypothetical protein|nr:hypothetical protein [Methylophaga sp.]MBL1459129.1 hypothetical protein [Methylophaga sp.]|tara:strand:+ start:504 stop:647 length:144 start_codon:yes stop_codon:yes gene_type:complete
MFRISQVIGNYSDEIDAALIWEIFIDKNSKLIEHCGNFFVTCGLTVK